MSLLSWPLDTEIVHELHINSTIQSIHECLQRLLENGKMNIRSKPIVGAQVV